MHFTLFYKKQTAYYYVYSYNSEHPNAFMYIAKSRFPNDTYPEKIVVRVQTDFPSATPPSEEELFAGFY